LLARYRTNEKGRLVKTADVYTKPEHKIDRNLIDQDAVKIAHRLSREGHKAYIVGGAVRDLILGKRPKDFDLVTDAEPNQIRRLFRNSRIIGKRFRLVHIFFHDDKIIELSTFRSIEAGTFNNVFGTIEEDALRRDFSANALYYDPLEETILDFVGGFRDLHARKLKAVIPLDHIFTEDPVRMIRAVKYAVTTGCRMGFFLRRTIKKSASLLADVSASRLSEEAFKILQGGYAEPIIVALHEYGLLVSIMPNLDAQLQDRTAFDKKGRILSCLHLLDDAVRNHRESRRSIQLSYLVADYLFTQTSWKDAKKPSYAEGYQFVKEFLKPVTPPNIEVEKCLVFLMRKRKGYLSDGVLPAIEPEKPGAEREEIPEGERPVFGNERRTRRHRAPAARTVEERTAPNASIVQEPKRPDSETPSKKHRRPRRRRKPGGPTGENQTGLDA